MDGLIETSSQIARNRDLSFIQTYRNDNHIERNVIFKKMESGKRQTVHIIERDSGLRARLARRLISAGYHAEIYAGISEIIAFSPKEGVVLIEDSGPSGKLGDRIQELYRAIVGIPIIVFCKNPNIADVVLAMRAHAVNYLSHDAPDAVLVAALDDAFGVGEDERAHGAKAEFYGQLISRLSVREQQVLEMLVNGQSNKGMAKVLGLSPRTIEIHRTKLMAKMGAKSPAEAVKMWCSAGRSD